MFRGAGLFHSKSPLVVEQKLRDFAKQRGFSSGTTRGRDRRAHVVFRLLQNAARLIAATRSLPNVNLPVAWQG